MGNPGQKSRVMGAVVGGIVLAGCLICLLGSSQPSKRVSPVLLVWTAVTSRCAHYRVAIFLVHASTFLFFVRLISTKWPTKLLSQSVLIRSMVGVGSSGVSAPPQLSGMHLFAIFDCELRPCQGERCLSYWQISANPRSGTCSSCRSGGEARGHSIHARRGNGTRTVSS